MSEQATVEIFCDSKGCGKTFSGFGTVDSEVFKEETLIAGGWAVADDGQHFCPNHKSQESEESNV